LPRFFRTIIESFFRAVKKLKRFILRSTLAKVMMKFLENKPFPGSNEVSWLAVVDFFVRRVDTRDIGLRTSALSFTFLLALFPSVIFIFTIIAYLPFAANANQVIAFLSTIMPDKAFQAIRSTLDDILKNQRGGLLSVGFLAAMYFSTNGFVALMKLLDKYSVQRKSKRSFWKQRVVALILSLIASFSLLVSVLFLTLGNYMIKLLNEFAYFPSKATPILLQVLNYSIVVVIVFTIVSAIYFLAPSKQSKWRFITPGSVFASSIIIITTIAFSTYVNQFNTYNKVYGSIGVLIVIMMLIYINTYILLLGYELNVAIDHTTKAKGQAMKVNRIIMLQEPTEELHKQ
jgi:membrane protein